VPAIVLIAMVAWMMRGGHALGQYVYAPATRGDVVQAVTATGTVNPVVTVQVGSYVSGPIVQMLCDFNTQVKKGQLCAKIDPRTYQNTLNQAKANLANANAQLHKDEATLAYNKVTYDRDSQLIRENVISGDQLDSAKSTYDAARAQVEVDRANIMQQEAAVNAATVNLGYTSIISPGGRNGGFAQRRSRTDCRRQLPDADALSDRPGPHQDAGRYQRQRVRRRSGAGWAEGRLSPSIAFPDRTFWGAVSQVRQSPITVQNVVTYDVVIRRLESRDASQTWNDRQRAHRYRRARQCSESAATSFAILAGCGRRAPPSRTTFIGSQRPHLGV